MARDLGSNKTAYAGSSPAVRTNQKNLVSLPGNRVLFFIVFSSNSKYNRDAGEFMIKTSQSLLSELKDYQNPYDHIRLLVKNGMLFKLRRGLYETDRNANLFSISSVLYSPSYISFETALSFYDLIPEKTVEITAASINARKRKEYINAFGRFSYQDVPSNVFSLGLRLIENSDCSYIMATKEKALCDLLSKIKDVGEKEFPTLLFDDLRLDSTAISQFKRSLVESIAKAYNRPNVYYLVNYLKKGKIQ